VRVFFSFDATARSTSTVEALSDSGQNDLDASVHDLLDGQSADFAARL
jgi:hypothetical protein